MANTLLNDISKDEKEWWIKFSYETAERERNAYFTNTLEQAKQIAMQQGMQQGIHQGQSVIIKNMLAKGRSFSEIAELTGLSENQVRSFSVPQS